MKVKKKATPLSLEVARLARMQRRGVAICDKGKVGLRGVKVKTGRKDNTVAGYLAAHHHRKQPGCAEDTPQQERIENDLIPVIGARL